jgi:hypothetical protein
MEDARNVLRCEQFITCSEYYYKSKFVLLHEMDARNRNCACLVRSACSL